MVSSSLYVSLASLAGGVFAALEVDLNSASSIRAAAKLVAYDLMTFYNGNETGQTPGILPGPPPNGDYYWWQGGAMWGTLIDYWRYTGDATYNPQITESLLHQAGQDNNYMPLNWTASLGNDDQAFWGMSALLAAENVFPDPPADDPRQWLALAQAVFNTQASPDRHDSTCNGGLRWQIPISNNGYDYKNSIANGCFFNIGARLARYTGNDSYAEWARHTWDWMYGVQFIDNENYNVYDGANVRENCTEINRAQFSYNAAVLLQGCAYMYNYTTGDEREIWRERTDLMLNATIRMFFEDDVAYEVPCEGVQTCTTDMISFKGYLHRWMAVTAQVAPWTRDTIIPYLRSSTEAAVSTCTGGANGRMCGFKWRERQFTDWPGTGAGQQMNVVAALSSYLIALESVEGPVTNSTGGTSRGNPGAGMEHSGEWWRNGEPAPTADKAGAAILTILLLSSFLGMVGWISVDEKTKDERFEEKEEKDRSIRASQLFKRKP